MFTGAMVALITPFQDGEIDFETLDELIEFQLEGGIDGIVPVGTTGESPTLSHDEQKKVMEKSAPPHLPRSKPRQSQTSLWYPRQLPYRRHKQALLT